MSTANSSSVTTDSPGEAFLRRKRAPASSEPARQNSRRRVAEPLSDSGAAAPTAPAALTTSDAASTPVSLPASSTTPWKPTKQQLIAAASQPGVPDLLSDNMKVLFCGINPGLYSGAVRKHFARPGNRFWPAMHAGGFTAKRLTAFDEEQILPDYGITNVVQRVTNSAAELKDEEYKQGAVTLEQKVLRYRPRVIAFLGIGSYRSAFSRKNAQLGLQKDHTIGDTRVWVLPSPSGLNAHHTPTQQGVLFGELKKFVDTL